MNPAEATDTSIITPSRDTGAAPCPSVPCRPETADADTVDPEMFRALSEIVHTPFWKDLREGGIFFLRRVLESLVTPDHLAYYKFRGLINLTVSSLMNIPRFPRESWNALLWQVVGLKKRIEISRLLGLDYFLHVGWTIQVTCSYRCRICPQKSHFKKHAAEILPYATADRFMREIRTFGYPLIGSYVGEPLMWPYFLDMVERHPRLFFISGTNGEYVPGLIHRIAQVRNLLLFVTLEGGPDTMARMRRTDAYANAVHAIRLLREHRKPFGVIIPVSRANFDEVIDMKFIRRQVYGRGAVFYCYSPYVGFDDRYSLTPEQERQVTRRIYEFQASWHGARSVCLDYMRGFNSTNLGNFYDLKQHCLEMDPTGDVHLVVNQNQFRIGNMGRESLVRMLSKKRTLAWLKENAPRGHLGMNRLTLGHWLQ